jgi:hypothetical protein
MSNFTTLTVIDFIVVANKVRWWKKFILWITRRSIPMPWYRISQFSFLTRHAMTVGETIRVRKHVFHILSVEAHHDIHYGDLNLVTATEIGYSTRRPIKFQFQYENSTAYSVA